MSVVFSVRIPRKLKKLMDECKGVNWAEEIRAFIDRRVREILMEDYLRVAREARKQLDKVPVPVDELIREDRGREY
ncbi:MAG: CopG family transcriptional regulator [Desulfurococcales archaeon ex4484_217_1]|nr:MAG: CopG family transcriptional regulator [Desulfurococcales archaeon ex4484_217_1]